MTDAASASAGPTRPRRTRAKSAERFHGFVSVQSRGAVMLPPAVRTRLGLDTPGAQLELTEREDGVLEVRPMLAIPADQAWFWTEHWQAGEVEVDEHVRAGQVTVSTSAEDFLADLDGLASHAEDDPSEQAHEQAQEHAESHAEDHAG
ncbi:AbrB/MazE/SpoVT family DNA-binding domain-containing protein [Quadrisphaera sp. INWT6]|uniref:AbrB/MazE/SpoVT family DNA-binding domain-containing protein n=1 Tax=Quadrisphaera sp. INWT6 TaxID=2596917 RepID=UPI0019D62DB5|nr:AbrB/MazE/SpoVT family DNA-binding domain-containing protein [Quadrisphaera sp. INWT6]